MGTVDLKNKQYKIYWRSTKKNREDYLRILRFIRFKIMYDIQLDLETISALNKILMVLKKFQRENIG